jgi:dihydrofolate reductase
VGSPAVLILDSDGGVMRKVTFGGANSLDNFIAGEDEGMDWLMWSDEANEVMKDYWPRIDCLLMGRKTYEVALKNNPGGESPYGEIETYIFSRTMEPGTRDGVTVVSENVEEFVRELKQREGREICVMGGGDLAKTLFEAGLIDEIGFNIHPVLLGSGVPLFHTMKRQIDLELIECKPFQNGCVYVLYKVIN